MPGVRYVIYTKVKKIFKDPSGWYIHFEGSWESINLGKEEPDFAPGDKMKITFERTEHDKASS